VCSPTESQDHDMNLYCVRGHGFATALRATNDDQHVGGGKKFMLKRTRKLGEPTESLLCSFRYHSLQLHPLNKSRLNTIIDVAAWI
jgi:hypothetical protein